MEPSIPIFIADSQNFFARNGLNVTIKYYQTGPESVNALLKDEVDMASPVSEYVLVGQAFNKEKIQTIGCFNKVEATFIVGRKDRGIETVPALKGKRIGVGRGTMLEFYLGRFLDLNGMNIGDVTLVNIPLPQSVDAILAGDIDAVVSVAPYTTTAREKLGKNAVYLPAQSGQLIYSLVVCNKEWIGQHPKLIERFLNAMNQAEEYITQHPDEAKAIAKKKLDPSDDDVRRVWSLTQFTLSLDSSLIVAMRDEARWMINNNLTTEKQVPNFLDYIYEDGLKAVKPGVVDIVR